MNKIDYSTYLDKVHGCWYGKCLGGAAGAPVEGIKKIIDVGDFTEIFNPDLPNDDLDLQLLWLDVLKTKGVMINSCDLADAWVEKCWYPFSEYGYFLKNYMRGIKPPYSGIINNSFFKEGMGCPIRSEIWGIISAGNPKLAAEYAYMDASLDHADNSVYAEQFLAAVESAAFTESNISAVLDVGMSVIPDDCRLSECFKLIIQLWHDGVDWISVRREVLSRYSHPDFTNVVQNLGFVLIALLWGGGDMRETINIALKCGYDTDCTCASAASIIGIIKGYSGLGDDITSLINDYFVCGIDIELESDSIKSLAEDTALIGLMTPNYEIEIENPPVKASRPEGFEGFNLEYPTDEGLKKALQKIEPVKWSIYGPFFDQLDQPINPNFPSPHGEGCVLPDLVCMVNNEVFIDKEYISDLSAQTLACVINAYEDFIDVDKYLTMEGQMCCYAHTVVTSPDDREIWMVVGNNDGFRIYVNGERVLEKDEMRLWTPYNNFTLVKLNKGKNDITVKLLRRGEQLKFSLGLRIYDGNHWHRSKWCTDLKY